MRELLPLFLLRDVARAARVRLSVIAEAHGGATVLALRPEASGGARMPPSILKFNTREKVEKEVNEHHARWRIHSKLIPNESHSRSKTYGSEKTTKDCDAMVFCLRLGWAAYTKEHKVPCPWEFLGEAEDEGGGPGETAPGQNADVQMDD